MRTAYLVAGLAFGDEGKGATTDYLVRKHQASLVVRYNGGAQAAHNVVTSDKKHHTFAQFGSGTLAGAKTHLSRHVLIEPLSMMNEAEHLRALKVPNLWENLSIEDRALVITPFQKAANRIIEYGRKEGCHGTCGLGIGQTRSDHLEYGSQVLFAGDLKDQDQTKMKLEFLRKKSLAAASGFLIAGTKDRKILDAINMLTDKASVDWVWSQYEDWPARVVNSDYLGQILASLNSSVVFEGAQGILIDEKFGFHPHTTWTDITFTNANELLAKTGFSGNVQKVGVLRTYFTRHGAGPFSTENKLLSYPELHNNSKGFQGVFRLGDFDWYSTRYAFHVIGGVDTIALNHLDLLPSEKRDSMVIELKNWLHIEDLILSYGPTADDRIQEDEERILNERISRNVNI